MPTRCKIIFIHPIGARVLPVAAGSQLQGIASYNVRRRTKWRSRSTRKNLCENREKKKLKYDRKKKILQNELQKCVTQYIIIMYDMRIYIYTSVLLENDGGDDDLAAAKYNVHNIVNTCIHAYYDDDDLPPLRPPKRDQTRNRKYAQCNIK